MKIAIASGKGGTGKTTLATNLALSLTDVVLLDCDVEEPNSHIFLDMNLKKIEEVYKLIPKVDENKCDFCTKCSKFCQYHALAVIGDEVLTFPELCHGCGGCILACPQNAIKEEKLMIGLIEGDEKDGLEFYQGTLKIGEAMATPIIKTLKKKIKKEKTVIIDSPPGTACPVIESVNETDYTILVTEPTPFGQYDLKLAVQMLRTMRIPFGVIINRDGIGDDRIELYCQEENIEILMKIPYNEDIARLYSKGVPFIHKFPKWKKEFIGLIDKIEGQIGDNN